MMALFGYGCTGGQETSAEELGSEKEKQAAAEAAAPPVNANKELAKISPAIPVYGAAEFRKDLTKRDSVMVKNQYGADSKVYTLAADDSFPKVWHYYVNYLAQYRGYEPPPAYPPENKNWRTMEVHLNEAMQDPFIPGDTLRETGKQVILQIAETEAEPSTVIRYIVTSRPPVVTQQPLVATGTDDAAPSMPGLGEEPAQ